MTTSDILKTIINVAYIAGFVALAIWTPMPWQAAALGIAATLSPSSYPALRAALGFGAPSFPAPPAASSSADAPAPPSYDTPIDGAKGGAS